MENRLRATFVYGFSIGHKYRIDENYLQDKYPHVKEYAEIVDIMYDVNVNEKVFYGIQYEERCDSNVNTKSFEFDENKIKEVDNLYDVFKNYLKRVDTELYLNYQNERCKYEHIIYGKLHYSPWKKCLDFAKEEEIEMERIKREKKEDAKFDKETSRIMKLFGK